MKSFTQKLLKLTFLFSIFFALLSAQAQAPQKMSYQAVVRNAANTLVANTAVGVKISVLQTSASGTSVYSERHTPTTNANGLATFEIGGGTVLAGTFATINWANGPYFIKTETDPTGGTNYTIAGTSQLASVPYALFAANGGTPGPQGIQGIQGVAGAAGTPGKNTAALTTVEPPGANCATGGSKLQFGIDANGNNALDATEINASLTKYVCNGATGATGAQGPAGTATNAWGLSGTAGTTASNFIGTTDNKPVVIKSNNIEVARANQNGTLYVGQANTDLLNQPSLAVKGEVVAYDGGKFKTSEYNENGFFENVTVTKNSIQATTLDPSNIPDPAPLTINPNGGNIGIQTGAIAPVNKVQIGNTPTFIGNDIAIGNGAQQMALTQSPTASTFYTNTNFALMPAGGTGNVGIGTDLPTQKLQVAGNIALGNEMYSTATGGLNMVPLGVIKMNEIAYANNLPLNNVYVFFTNEVGNLGYAHYFTAISGVNDQLSFVILLDPAITNNYTKVIVVGSPGFDNYIQSNAIYAAAAKIQPSTSFNNPAGSGGFSLTIFYYGDNLNNIKPSGTYMIYGIK
jgi:hypothetical protein